MYRKLKKMKSTVISYYVFYFFIYNYIYIIYNIYIYIYINYRKYIYPINIKKLIVCLKYFFSISKIINEKS